MKFLQKLYTKLPALIIGSYIVVFLCLLLSSVFTNAPRELRDTANVSLSLRFANMQNPYKLSDGYDFAESVNVYPPVNMIIAGFIYTLTNFNLFHIFYFLDFIYVTVSTIVIARFIRKEFNISYTLSLLAFASALTLGWRTGFISTVPDHLGMLICIILLISVYKNRANKSILFQSFLTVLAFYSKQYFLAIAVSVFIYYLLKNYKNAILYFLYTAIIGLLSFALICLICPSFSVQIIFFMFAENEGMDSDKIIYSLRQMALVFATYGIYLLFTAKRYVLFIRDVFVSKKPIPFTIFDINTIIMFFILLYLGTNKGAFLSYHLTLLIPGILITGILEMYNFLQHIPEKSKYAAELLICIISLALLYKKYQFPYIYSKVDYDKYYYIESMLEKYGQDKLYLTPQLGYYALTSQNLPSENGHHDYIISLADGKVINTPVNIDDVSFLFPYIDDIYSYSVIRKNEIITSVKNQEFALIARSNGSSMLYGYDISGEYECIYSVLLRTGLQNYSVELWAPCNS
ncbi:MAG: hypothetical protein NC313_15170 [Butyrivibrio sp.]|nr:hypothetical protein [Butyrivibrio sp.]